MRDKIKITEENYKEQTLKRAIIACWILLIICFIIKLFGGNLFDINVNDENFVKVCNYLDTSWFRFIAYYLLFCLEYYSLLKISNTKIKVKTTRFLSFILLSTMYWIFKLIIDLGLIEIDQSLFGIIGVLVTYSLIAGFSRNWWKPILIMIYQLILVSLSTFIKNISFLKPITSSFLNTTIFCIDYYLLLILTILYRVLIEYKKIRRQKNGIN